MSQGVTQEDILEVLQAFEHSHFTRLELTLGSVRVAADKTSPVILRSDAGLRATAQVVAPLLGLFQAGPQPGAAALVQPGTKVDKDTTVGFIRVLQKSTAVKAGLSGMVVSVCVDDGQFVEFGQTLLRLASTESATRLGSRPEADEGNGK